MDFSVIVQRLNDLTTFMNNVRTLSKKIFQLPPSTEGIKWVATYNETSEETEKFNLTDALNGMYSLTNGITATGNIVRDAADFTFEVGFEWLINGIEYSNTEITRTINDAGTGNHRVDIAVCDTNNDIYIVEGFEVPLATAVVQPPTPPNTLFICSFFINESVIGDNTTPILVGQNNIPLRVEILSTDLTTNNIAGFVNYINNLNPALTVLETNSLVQYYLTDTNEIYQFSNIGKGVYGQGNLQITSSNVLNFKSGGSQDLQQILENGATYTALGKTLTIYSDVISIFDNGTLSALEIGMGDGPENTIFMIYTPTVGGQTQLFFPKTESIENVAYQSYVDTGLSDKVDKVAGKQLSTEDYTTEEKSKLAGIASGANLSGTNTGDDAINSNYASDYRASNFIADTDYLTPNTANNLFDFKPVVYNKTTNLPIISSATINNVEGLSIIAAGPVARNFADTNLFTRTQRLGLVASITGGLAQIRQLALYINGNTGYEVIYKFGFSDNATDTAIRAFIGLSTNNIFSNVEPDTLLNCIAVGRLSTSNNLHLIHNDNTGTATTIDLGSNFPANTIDTDVYTVKLITLALSNTISVYIERVNTGDIYTTTLTTDIPALSQGLNFGGYIVDTTGANTSTGIDFMGMYVKN